MTPIWLEVHVDDVRLSRDASAWPDVAAKLDAWARLAEGHGARLSFRFRETFARLDTHGFVRGLVARGHEAGWHAHATRLRAARDAVVAAGGDARIAAPGLVQARFRRALLARAWALGARLVTDRSEAGRPAYAGWLAREPLPGMTMLDVSVSPWAWGLDFRRLSELAEVATRWAAPEGSRPFFGATWHEHDAPVRFEEFLGRWGERVVVSGAVAREAPAVPVERASSPHPPPCLRASVPPCPPLERLGPRKASAALVVVHGGESGLVQRLRFLGLPDDAFGDVAVWLFARGEGARTPGNPVHVAETRAVLDEAAKEGVPVGMLTWSGGVVNALHTADARVRFLVDVEGPADRFSLVPPRGNELSAYSLFDDPAWAGKEAVALIPVFAGRYVRVQGADDHVHGRVDWHARRMVEAARDGRLVRVPGRVDRAGATVVSLVRELLRG